MKEQSKELTKDEALDIQDLHFKTILLDADLKQLNAQLQSKVQLLAKKYHCPVDKFQLHVRKGEFIEIKDEPSNNKDD